MTVDFISQNALSGDFPSSTKQSGPWRDGG